MRRFLKNLGIDGRRDVIFLAIFYAVAWVMCVAFRREIPAFLLYALTALPICFFVFGLIFWGLRTFFGYFFRKLPIPWFVTLCAALWCGWTVWLTVAYDKLILIRDKKIAKSDEM